MDVEGNPVVRDPSTQSWFAIEFTPSVYHAEYAPGQNLPEGATNWGPWESTVRKAFPIWLQAVKREASPDLWAQLAHESELVDASHDEAPEGNAPFSASERETVTAQLREIRELLMASRELSAEQRRTIEVRLKYLEEASGRMGRRDWLNIFVGSMFTLAVEAIVPPEAVQEVLRVAARGIGFLFGDAAGFELPA